MAAYDLEQIGGTKLACWDTRDAVTDLVRRVLPTVRATNSLEGLRKIRPWMVAAQQPARRQFPYIQGPCAVSMVGTVTKSSGIGLVPGRGAGCGPTSNTQSS